MRLSLPIMSGLLLVVTSAAADEPFRAPVDGLYPGRDAQCGPRCLYAALTRLGHEPNYLHLMDQAGTDARGTSIAGLARAVEEQGAHSVAVSVSESRLVQLLQTADEPLVAICHLSDPGHFVLMHRTDDGRVVIVDPQKDPPAQWEPLSRESYSGAALLVSNSPIVLAEINAAAGPSRWRSAGLLAVAVVAAFGGGFWFVSRRPAAARALSASAKPA